MNFWNFVVFSGFLLCSRSFRAGAAVTVTKNLWRNNLVSVADSPRVQDLENSPDALDLPPQDYSAANANSISLGLPHQTAPTAMCPWKIVLSTTSLTLRWVEISVCCPIGFSATGKIHGKLCSSAGIFCFWVLCLYWENSSFFFAALSNIVSSAWEST